MGVYVSLHIDPKHIDQSRWHTIFQQTLQLLKAYKGGLFAAKDEMRGPHRRTFLSRELLRHNRQTGNPYWTVMGDFESKLLGEPFTLSADLSEYSDSGHFPPTIMSRDILASIVADKTPGFGNVFQQKTQGHPYHRVILAAAMWVEHCFPKHAFVSGDIDKAQCMKAAAYIWEHIGEEVSLPVCVSPERLLSRLSDISHGFECFDHFKKVFRGSQTDALASLFQYANRETVTTWFTCQLKQYGDPSQFGVIDWFSAWLNACEDLDSLCYLACSDENGPRFPAAAFGAGLAATWIGVSRSQREVIDSFLRPQGEAETVYSQFGGIFLDMSGLKGRHIKACLPMSEIRAVFEEHFSREAREVEIAFQEKQDEVLCLLAQIKEPVESLTLGSEDETLPIMDGMEFMNLGNPAGLPEKYTSWLDGMARLVCQWRQETSESVGQPNAMEMDSPNLINLLWHCAESNDIWLTEDAWSWLEEEDDRELLLTAAALMCYSEKETKFTNIRWAILENRSLCEYVGNRSYEDLELEEKEKYVE